MAQTARRHSIEETRRLLTERIEAADRDLRSDQTTVSGEGTADQWRMRYERWRSYTYELLQSLYSTDEPAEDFMRKARRPSRTTADWRGRHQQRIDNLAEALNELDSLIERAELLDDAAVAMTEPGSRGSKDPRRVMVVHGRNTQARNAMFGFLRALGLLPIEWEDAIAATGTATPHNLAAVRAAMDMAQAVVVLLTAEDQAGLLPELASEPAQETALEGQPRQNVILEAGMAMALDPERTILVQLGRIRGASDFDGLNAVRLDNAPAQREALRRRLNNAGCLVAEGNDWLSAERAGDFETCIVGVRSRPLGRAHSDVMAIPTVDMSGNRFELNVRCFRLPEGTRVVCAVTAPNHDPVETDAPGQAVGAGQTLHSVVYPDSFDGSAGVAGTHVVEWLLVHDGGERDHLVTTDFRVP